MGWLRLARVNGRSGPKCASIGFAQDALVGVKQRWTLWSVAQRRIFFPLWGGEVVQDHVDRGAVGADCPDRAERGQGVQDALPPATTHRVSSPVE
ncbi:hypothetical protein BG452_33525 [Streptomyces sp. CBMA123]|nr:hypothetical protein [Streptomyces sp. CBMA123]